MGNPSEYGDVGKHEENEPMITANLSVAGPLLPLAVQQGPQKGEEEGEILWLAKDQRAPAYLDLLYDLAIAAVLSVFGDKHQIMNGQSVLAYFSYFILIWWVWASQVLYDTRFQANDWTHRLFKFLQLGAFTYVGVFAQNFDPTNVVRPADITTQQAVGEVGGALSFKGAALAMGVSRMLLAVQYLYITCVTQKRARRQHLESFLLPIVTCLICAQFWIIAGLLNGSQTTKLALGYFALATEVAVTLGASHLKNAIAPDSGLLAERFADLTLVILAEGVLGVVKTLADVVAGFGLNAGGSELNGYSECICCLVIVFGIWHFIFHAFNPDAQFKSRRTSSGWAFLHLPLHFVILLVLSSMKTVAVYENVDGALTVLAPIFEEALNNTGLTEDRTLFDSFLTPENILQLNKLHLEPQFIQEINLLNDQVVIAELDNGTLPYFDPVVNALQYAAQLFMEVGTVYDITFSWQTEYLVANLSNLPSNWNTNDTQANITESEALDLWYAFGNAYNNDLATPSLFFLPCAGGLVILAALLTVFRTQGSVEESSAPDEIYGQEIETSQDVELQHVRPPRKRSLDSQWSYQDRLKKLFWIPIYIWEWVPLGVHLVVGVALCLSGFLDKPTKTGDIIAFDILYDGWSLPIVAICFAGLIVLDLVVLVLVRVAKGGSLLDKMPSSSSISISLVPVTPPARPDRRSAPTLPSLSYGNPTMDLPHLSPELLSEGPRTPLLSQDAQAPAQESTVASDPRSDTRGRNTEEPEDEPFDVRLLRSSTTESQG